MFTEPDRARKFVGEAGNLALDPSLHQSPPVFGRLTHETVSGSESETRTKTQQKLIHDSAV
jgi:hypothetical protein